jgi:PIN domain nuclease of toxin-antitoxin system
MNFLVDTQILLWTLANSSRLSEKTLRLFNNDVGKNAFFFSQISLYEIAIKQKIGKLPEVTTDIELIYNQLIPDGYDFLPLHNRHIETYKQVPLLDHYRDPFDRLLLATALAEKMTIVSADEQFKSYQDIIPIFEAR